MTKEDVANNIKKYCNGLSETHPIYLAMGSGGTSWNAPYDQGIWAMCEAIAKASNTEDDRIQKVYDAADNATTFDDFKSKLS